MPKLGEPAFMGNFGTPNIICYILDNGVEGDLVIGRESQFETIHTGPYHVLLDKKDILKGVVFNRPPPDPGDQVETLRRMITWFWHDWVHFTTALQRGQLWWAQGQLEILRVIVLVCCACRMTLLIMKLGMNHISKLKRLCLLSSYQDWRQPLAHWKEDTFTRPVKWLPGYIKISHLPLPTRTESRTL
jgi:hypothetical protein